MNETTVRKIVREELMDVKSGLNDVKEDVSGLKTKTASLEEELRHFGMVQEQHTEMLLAIGEGIQNLQELPKQMESMNTRVTRLEIDMDVLKPVVKEHNHDIKKLKSRTGPK